MVGKEPSRVLATTEHTCCLKFKEVVVAEALVCSLPSSVLEAWAATSRFQGGNTRDRFFGFLGGLWLAEEDLTLPFHFPSGLAVDDEEEVVFADEFDVEETPSKEAAGTNPEDVEIVVVPKDVIVVVSCIEGKHKGEMQSLKAESTYIYCLHLSIRKKNSESEISCSTDGYGSTRRRSLVYLA